MKRTLIMMAIVLYLASMAIAATFHTANQATVAWDAVTAKSDGTPLPSGDIIKYDVYLANAVTDPGKTNPAMVIADLENLQHTITLNSEGKYYVGVKAKRYVDGVLVNESSFAWSDDPQQVAAGETFGLQYFLPPAAPVLRKTAQ